MGISVKWLTGEPRESLFCSRMSLYLDGECYALAIALSQGLGWPLVGFMQKGTISHVGVQSHQGAIYDARGKVTEEEFTEYFGSTPDDLVAVSEKDLLTIRPVHQESINTARKLAETLWPELPWKDSEAKKAVAFVEELEKLSRKHGYWIDGTVPAMYPILRKGYGDEKGYKLRVAEDGSNVYFTKRWL